MPALSIIPLKDFASVRGAWNDLNQVTLRTVLLSSDFIEPLIETFSGGNECIVIAKRNDNVVALAIVQPSGRNRWRTWQPSQAPIGMLLCRPGEDLALFGERALRAMPGYALTLDLMQLDPALVPRPAESAVFSTSDYIRTAWIPVDGNFDDYWNRRGKNLRHNVRRQCARLGEAGTATRLAVATGFDDAEACVRDYGELESGGWKSTVGTAVHIDNGQGQFYKAMLRRHFLKRKGRVYRYYFGDRLVASDLCIHDDRMIVILKTAYDESVKAFSPATLMRHAYFRPIFDGREFERVEFYGRVMDWHTQWSGESRVLYHATAYRHPALRTLHQLMHQTHRLTTTEQALPS